MAIVGAGGMGKSGIALAVLSQNRIRDKFPDGRCFFVRVDKAESGAALIDELHRCVIGREARRLLTRPPRICPDTGKKGEHPLKTVLDFLRSRNSTLIVLDNFEIPFHHSLGKLRSPYFYQYTEDSAI